MRTWNVFIVLAIIGNVILILLLKNDLEGYQSKVRSLASVRVELPQEFVDDVTKGVELKTVELSDRILNETRTHLLTRSESVMTESSSAIQKSFETNSTILTAAVEQMCQKSNASVEELKHAVVGQNDKTLQELERRCVDALGAARNGSSQCVATVEAEMALFRKRNDLNAERVKDAEACYGRYLSSPTNAMALLNLQTAIRKNPNELKYIETLKSLFDENPDDEVLGASYRMLLSYSLDVATGDALAVVVQMAAAYQNSDRMKSSEINEESDVREQVAEIQKELNETALQVEVCETNSARLARRVALLRELNGLLLDDSVDDQLATAETVLSVVQGSLKAENYLRQAEWAMESIASRSIESEMDLKCAVDALTGSPINQPLTLALQCVQTLYGIDFSPLPTNVSRECAARMKELDKRVQAVSTRADEMKADRLISFVDRLADQIPSSVSYTRKLKEAEIRGRIISKYVSKISNPIVADRVLTKQLNILDESKRLQKCRLRLYQDKVLRSLRCVIASMKDSQSKMPKVMGKVAYKGKAAEGFLLGDLAAIDRSLLTPEMSELYHDVYGRAMSDYTAWIDDAKKYEDKAELLEKIENHEKWGVEDL